MRWGSSARFVTLLAASLAPLLALAAPAQAGTVVGKLELPPAPERPPVVARGFLDRTENPLADIRKLNLAPYLVVVLEGDSRTDATPGPVTWDVVGESFARPVIAVPVGAEVVIRNVTSFARTVAAAEDAKLIVGPLNPTGTKSFRVSQPAVYTISDKDAPHLRGRVVVVASRHVGYVDDAGRFEIADVPEGNYKLRVYFADPTGRAADWLPLKTEVVVGPRGKGAGGGKTEVSAKLPALGAPAAAGSASPAPVAPTGPAAPAAPPRPGKPGKK